MSRALVTGGTRGIGAAVARVLASAGHDVVVSGSSSSASPPEGCSYVQCDFADMDRLAPFVRDLAEQHIDILVNNAGINKIGFLSDYAVEDFQKIQQVNVTAPFMVCQAVIPQMKERRYGRIVNISSIFGVVSKPERSAYSASKFGLLGLSRALALEVAPDNVLVNCVAPGFVDTELTHQILGEEGIKEITSGIPIGRLASPDEIAYCVNFLASDQNTYLTGQNIIVDGGFTSA